jgi:hypothetical protein
LYDCLLVGTVAAVPLPLCLNCHKPARYIYVEGGHEYPSCGKCHMGVPDEVRELESGDSFAPATLPESLPEWSTTEEVGALFKLKAATIRGYIRAGELKASGTPYRIHRDALRAWADARPASGSGKATQRPKARKAPKASTFTDRVRKRT